MIHSMLTIVALFSGWWAMVDLYRSAGCKRSCGRKLGEMSLYLHGQTHGFLEAAGSCSDCDDVCPGWRR